MAVTTTANLSMPWYCPAGRVVLRSGRLPSGVGLHAAPSGATG